MLAAEGGPPGGRVGRRVREVRSGSGTTSTGLSGRDGREARAQNDPGPLAAAVEQHKLIAERGAILWPGLLGRVPRPSGGAVRYHRGRTSHRRPGRSLGAEVSLDGGGLGGERVGNPLHKSTGLHARLKERNLADAPSSPPSGGTFLRGGNARSGRKPSGSPPWGAGLPSGQLRFLRQLLRPGRRGCSSSPERPGDFSRRRTIPRGVGAWLGSGGPFLAMAGGDPPGSDTAQGASSLVAGVGKFANPGTSLAGWAASGVLRHGEDTASRRGVSPGRVPSP